MSFRHVPANQPVNHRTSLPSRALIQRCPGQKIVVELFRCLDSSFTIATEGSRVFELLGDRPIVVGRAKSSNLVLDNASISRQHAVVRETPDGRWQIIDRGATQRREGQRHRRQGSLPARQ